MSAANHSGSSSHLYSTPDELDRLSRTFTVVSFEMSTTATPSSLTLDKLEAETVIRARVCSENLAIERSASPELLVLATGSVWSVFYRLSVSAESVSYSP